MGSRTSRIVVGLAAAATLGASVIAVAPAANAAGCGWFGCDYRNPESTGCASQTRTIATDANGVELRYSPICAAYWARGKIYAGASYLDISVERRCHTSRCGGTSVARSSKTIPTSGGTGYTNMLGRQSLTSPDYDYRVCSTWYNPSPSNSSCTTWTTRL